MGSKVGQFARQVLAKKNEWIDLPPDQFKQLLVDKKIRPASLEDVNHTHHKRPIYRHPNTKQPWVLVNA